MGEDRVKIAIVYPGDAEVRKAATPENNRFAPLFKEFAEIGVHAEPAVYHPDFAEQVYEQLLKVDGVLVWVNPIQDGHDRTVLDATLRKVADAGIYVSTHPDIILKMGTKEVLYQTRHMGWGSDIHLYKSWDQMRSELSAKLANGEARVLKQNRGHSGIGVWKIQALEPRKGPLTGSTSVKVRHAERGSIEEVTTLDAFFERCRGYFSGAGQMLDQEYQKRLPEGTIRCYLVHDKVAGFGHQKINALYPAPEGGVPGDAPQPGPRLYYPPDLEDFQKLKAKLENIWLPELQELLGIPRERLPALWDADFFYGAKNSQGEDTYVLCEMNVSSVAPYPDSATPILARAAMAAAKHTRAKRLVVN